MWANSSQIALPQLFIIQYSFVPRIIPVAPSGDIVPMATFSGRPGRGVPTGKQINRTP